MMYQIDQWYSIHINEHTQADQDANTALTHLLHFWNYWQLIDIKQLNFDIIEKIYDFKNASNSSRNIHKRNCD